MLCRADKSCMQTVLLRAKECFIIKEHDPSLCDQNEKHMSLDDIKCCDHSNELFLKPWNVFPDTVLYEKITWWLIVSTDTAEIFLKVMFLWYDNFFLFKFKIQISQRESPIIVKFFVPHSFFVVLLLPSCFMLGWVKPLYIKSSVIFYFANNRISVSTWFLHDFFLFLH